MKPHIKLTRFRMPTAVWRCALENSTVFGFGQTPSQAYYDWDQKWKRANKRRRAP